MFVGREKELTRLNQDYKRGNFELSIIYGRRRVGKTSIIKEFIKDKKNILFSAEEMSEEMNLRKFSKAIRDGLSLISFPDFGDWEEAFNYLIDHYSTERLVIVIDEFPYIAKVNHGLNSKLQHLIDHKLKDTNFFLNIMWVTCWFYGRRSIG